MSFTVFVILPNEVVCSLRRLPSRSSIRTVRKMLELSAGLPAQTYDLSGPDGKFLADDILLQLDKNVWDGYLMRAFFRGTWQELFEAVEANNVGHVMKYCALHAPNKNSVGKVKDETTERGVVALFKASFLGFTDLCKALLCGGVDPDSETSFGRTPLFAAISGDHAHIMEVLLSHHATLETRDEDDTSAVDFAQEQQAKECLRKIRYLKLFSRASSATSSRASRSSVRGSDHLGGLKTQHPVIRIPTEASADPETPDDKTFPPAMTSHEDSSVSHTKTDSFPIYQEAVLTNGVSATSETLTGGSKPSPRSLFQNGEVYTWENNLRSVSRASSAAGTQVRIPVPGSGRERVSSGRSISRASNGVTWGDAISVNPAASRRSSLRLSVQDFMISGLNPVLKVTRPVSPPHTNHITDINLTLSKNIGKYCEDQERTSNSLPYTKGMNDPHVHAQDSPEQAPSPVENSLHTSKEEEKNQTTAGPTSIFVSDVPQARKDDCGYPQRVEPGRISHNSDGGKLKGHQFAASHDNNGSRSSFRAGAHLAKSRRKQEASWKTMKRRLKLAEDQKRHVTPRKTNRRLKGGKGDTAAARATFEQWLQRKRKEQERRQENSSDADSSSEDAEDEERSAENEKAFNDWLRELKERRLRGPHPFTPASLHRRKSRPLKNLIQIGVSAEEAAPSPDPDAYMTAYQEWRQRGKASAQCAEQLTSPRHLKEAQRQMEEKRKSLLAVALTYEDWLEHSEERQRLMQALLRVDSERQAHLEENMLRTRRAPRQISFHQWRENVDRKREAETRHGGVDKQRGGGKHPGTHDVNNGGGFLFVGSNDGIRSSAAIPHEEWLKRKKKEKEKSRNERKVTVDDNRKTGPSVASDKQETPNRNGQEEAGTADAREDCSAAVSEDGKESAWETWLQQKHEKEMEQLQRHTYEGKQLLLSVREKKAPRVT